MTTITAGMTRSQFITSMNANFAELAVNCGANISSFVTLTLEMSGDQLFTAINHNFRASAINFGMNGSSYISSLNSAFGIVVNRFQDVIVNNAGLNVWVEPTALVSDDGNQVDLWVTGGYTYSTNGVNFAALVATDVTAGYQCTHMLKEGNTYYLYATRGDFNSIHLFTSTNKINFTDQGEVIALGAVGTWDSGSLGNMFVWKEGLVWYMLYEATGALGWQIGLAVASAPEGAWAKYISNPVISELLSCGNPELPRVNNQVIKSTGRYYCYYHQQDNAGVHTIKRAYSLDLHVWVHEGDILGSRIDPSNSAWTNGDQALVQFKGKSYMFYTNDANGGTSHLDIGVDNRTLAELLALYP